MIRLLFFLVITICLYACSNKPQSISNLKIDFIDKDNFNSYSVKLFDTLEYIREYDKRKKILTEYYKINNKIEGIKSYSKNRLIDKKIYYKNNKPISLEEYYYSNNQLDSVIAHLYTEKTESGFYNVTRLGKLIYNNGIIDKKNSNYYTFDSYKPYLRESDYDVMFNIKFWTSLDRNCVLWGVLDSTNYKLEKEFDMIYSDSLFIDIYQRQKNFTGLYILEGNFLFCNNINNKEMICSNRIPFYYPILFIDKKNYDNISKQLKE